MGSVGSILTIVAIIVAVLALAAAVGFYVLQKKGGSELPRFFAPRFRRLAFIERTGLDGGRKLLLVRRDNVEHLILIGGPIDLIVETGIRWEGVASVHVKEEDDDPVAFTPSPLLPPAWQPHAHTLSTNPVASSESRFSLSSQIEPAGEDTLELTALHEAKAAQ